MDLPNRNKALTTPLAAAYEIVYSDECCTASNPCWMGARWVSDGCQLGVSWVSAGWQIDRYSNCCLFYGVRLVVQASHRYAAP